MGVNNVIALVFSIVASLLVSETVSYVSDPVSAALDSMLIRPFCERTSVKGIINVCVTVAPEKVDNEFCKDYLTTAPKGSITAKRYLFPIRWCAFQLTAKDPEQKYLIKCYIGDATNSPLDSWVAMYPLQSYGGQAEIKTPGTETVTKVRGVYTGGAAIIMNAAAPLKCTWEPTTLPSDGSLDKFDWTD